MRRMDFQLLAILLAGVVVLTAACSASPYARSALTPTATYPPTYRPVPVATPQAGLISLTLPETATSLDVAPSPDGSLIAVIGTAQPNVMTLYDLQGQVQGRYALPADAQPVVAWVPDSSGLLVWATFPSTNDSGPLVLLDRQAHVLTSGLNGTDAALSPDRTWIAFTHLVDTHPTNTIVLGDVEVALRTGGSARVVARSARFLGWQGQRMVYYATGSIFAINPAGGNAVLLAAAPGGNVLQPPLGGPASSPDGQVLLSYGFRETPYLLVGTQVRQPPSNMPQFDPYPWVGGHDVLAVSSEGQNVFTISNDFQIVDIFTGALLRDTGIAVPGVIGALAGDWILWTDTSNTIHLANLRTKATHNIGPAPFDGNFLPLGPGRFLLQLPRQTQAYIIDPALAR